MGSILLLGKEECALCLVDVLAVVSSLCNQGVEDQRGFGKCKGINMLKLAQVKIRASFLVAGRRGLRAGCLVRHCERVRRQQPCDAGGIDAG